METINYFNPVNYILGKGTLELAGKQTRRFGKRVLFVYGREHLVKTGAYNIIIESLKKENLGIIELSGVQPNPRVSLVRKGIEICRKEKIDFILGAGGGSVSDTTKAIAVGAGLDADIWEAYETFHCQMHGRQPENPVVPTTCLPFGVIMTKPGTGSDFDSTSVLSNWEQREKLMLINDLLFAKFVIIDPATAFTLPAEQTAFGVADMMTHIMEQYFTKGDNLDIQTRYKEANLINAIQAGMRIMESPNDFDARAQLFYIASWACSAQSMAGAAGGWDAHMIEHELTALTDLNHGHGMAMVYYGWMKYVLESIPNKFARFSENVWGVKRDGKSDYEMGAMAIEKTKKYWQELGISLTLSSVNIEGDAITTAAKQAVRFGNLGIVKELGEGDVKAILESVAN